jgi:anionic cell wall polymer biosynthesis LytR-Cps2A-Psr (LCP) family protein
MKRKQPSLDGFIPRRPYSQLGQLHDSDSIPDVDIAQRQSDRQLHTTDTARQPIGVPRESQLLGRNDIDESLSQIDDDDEETGMKGFKKRKRIDGKVKPPKKVKRIVKWSIIALVTLLLGIGIFLGVKLLLAGNSIFNGNIFDLLQSQPLQEDENGRSNFLILGTSEDDPGHPAGMLTDSMMILSVDQTKKNAYMISIPRDLYVDYGRACPAGYQGRINAFFSCISSGTDDAAEQERLNETQELVGEIFDMDIQYGAHVNYTVVRDVIDAIGGEITLTIESRHPNGILDSNFDWKCGASYNERLANCPPDGHFLQYPNGEVTLDAEHALYLAQARGDRAPTYGLEQSNFDREKNQQKVLVAIKEKAVSAGTLTNIGAVTGLIDALGSNLRTNIQTKELRTLMDLGVSIESSNITSISLIDADPSLLTTGPVDGASVVMPTAGIYEYGDLQAYVAKSISSDPVIREAANISVLNGSGIVGAATEISDELTAKNYTISEVGNAPEGDYEAIEIYQLNDKKSGTADALSKLYGVTIKTDTPPVSVVGETDFVVIVGQDPSPESE